VVAHFDIAVIGGGINGAGIARDAATRGLDVILLEKDDFGAGTTSGSSRLIHGGLRYLEHAEIPLVFESLHERRRLRQTAPHLVRPLGLLIPVFRDSRRGKFIIRLGMIAYDLLSIGKKLPGHQMLTPEELIQAAPGIRRDGLVGGARYYDAQVSYPERLVVENIVSAEQAGADVRNYSPVIGISVRNGTVRGLQFIDHASGNETEIATRVVINAAGPWVDRVLGTVNREMPAFMGGTKVSHIVVGRFDGAPECALYVEAKSDGRPFFIIPWNDQFLIGTTDIRYDGDPGDVTASGEEIDYLLNETNRVFPGADLGRDDIHYTCAAVRPLPKREKGPESAITRKHLIVRHRKQARGLISVIGGKLTTYRNLAEQVVDRSVRILGGKARPCVTRDRALPGGADLEAAERRLAEIPMLSGVCRERLLSIYGSRAPDIVLAAGDVTPAEFIDAGQTVLAAEVRHALINEMAVNLVDIVHRRMMTGLRPDQGVPLNEKIATLAADYAGWNRAETARQLAELRRYDDRMRVESRKP
jgi:glycerol-3-phosphate dehydrogenase